MAIDLTRNPPNAELFNSDAERVAIALNQAAPYLNKSTQIRRFFDELVGWQERIGDDENKFREQEAFIKMLNAKVAYAKGRKLVDDTFEAWFRDCIKATTTAVALKHFRLHFEAVIGFLKAVRG